MDNINQSAYKSGPSTEIALLKIKNDIQLNLSKGPSTSLVLLDLTFDHLQLTERLSSCLGLSEGVGNWSYMSNWNQSIKISDTVSAP